MANYEKLKGISIYGLAEFLDDADTKEWLQSECDVE